MRHLVAPDPLVDPLARDHAALRGGQQVQQLELPAREAERPAADERLEHVGPDLELARHDGPGRLGRRGAGLARAAARASTRASTSSG